VQWLKKAAIAGDAPAQFELAKALHEGKMGLAQDLAQAWKWFELAAKQGDGKASFMLARMAAHGQGVPRDLELSVQWLQEGSHQRNAQAMYQLSAAYANGEGIPRNMMQARYWLNMSAEHDYNVAVQALAMELDGLGGQDSPFAERSRQLFKEARDHRLMRWNTHQ
jgi:TPR repeat protein